MNKNNNMGYIGLENLGNTCFMNSCLQILKEIAQISNIINENINNNKLHDNIDSILTVEWNNLNNMMINNNGVIRPSRFLDTLQKYSKKKKYDLFTGYSQNDIQEFFLLLINALHNSISIKKTITINGVAKNDIDLLAIECYKVLSNYYKNEYSDINKLFQGIQVNIIQGLQYKGNSIRPEIFADICLPIFYDKQIAKNIYDCFDIYVKHEFLNGDNKWYNEKEKKKEDAVKYIRFWSFPDILFIMFKRFSYNGRSKLNNIIDFPIDNLNLSKYVCGYKPESYVYELFGVCNHSGSTQGGHYTSFVKNKHDKWLHFNDTIFNEINIDKIVTAKAYCLFYRKKNN